MVGGRGVGWQRCGQGQVGINFAEEKPRAGLLGEQVAVFANPAQPGFFCQCLFQDWCAIGKYAIAKCADGLFDACRQFLHALAQYFVIIASQRITGNVGFGGIGENGFGVGALGWQIIQPCTDHADGAGFQFGRATTLGAVFGHVIHAPVSTFAPPVEQVCFCGIQLCIADPQFLEPQFLPPTPDVGGQFVPVRRLFAGVVVLRCVHSRYDSAMKPASDNSSPIVRLRWQQCPLPPRKPAAHKGDFGHVLVVGGDHGMSGACRLAGEAALRTGAGLVSVATRMDHAAIISAARPELMSHGVESVAGLLPLLKRATVLAVGPGLGQGEWGRTLFSTVLGRSLPMVVDADALNLLAVDPMHRDNWILTPHIGEAARLLQQNIEHVQAERITAASALQKKYGGVVVLKGEGTVIVDGAGVIGVCSEGNPGMASGGMGDVLTGVIAGLLAQGCSLSDAARQGVCLHAHAADVAATDGQRGLLASDLFPVIRHLLD